MNNTVTKKQWLELILHFKYRTHRPSVDEAIDWLRRKYSIVIYEVAEPFVSPATNKIEFSYGVKLCNTQWGWNARKILGQTKWGSNPYSLKRKAITIALDWLKKNPPKKKIINISDGKKS